MSGGCRSSRHRENGRFLPRHGCRRLAFLELHLEREELQHVLERDHADQAVAVHDDEPAFSGLVHANERIHGVGIGMDGVAAPAGIMKFVETELSIIVKVVSSSKINPIEYHIAIPSVPSKS